jgi:chromosome segregation protein
MLKIDRFRLQGFKSFSEPAEVHIGSGMTGIVGPNGCGKSNLVEALKWAMGETSFKQMRAGDSMEDLIFAGTDTRPPRNSAEVVVTVDNSGRTAPAELNDADVLEVSRRMERGDGSSYKVNGRPVRARDVQILYKDAGIGAKSSALVSQGKVSDIIRAKPSDRISIVDEAAGTAGLAERRREADMRLRGTEQNLEKAEALEEALSSQLSSLRTQARRAQRRKEIDGLVRKAEATAFLVRWRIAAARIAEGMAAHGRNEEIVKDLMIRLSTSTAALASVEAESAPLTKARSEAETAVALARVAVDTARRDAVAARNALAGSRKNADRTAADLQRERDVLAESSDEYEDLKDQLAIAKDDSEYDATLIEEASVATEDARVVMDDANEALATGTADLVRAQSELKSAETRISDARRARDSVLMRASQARTKAEDARTSLAALPAIPDAQETAERDLQKAHEDLASAEAVRTKTVATETTATAAAGAAASVLHVLEAEKTALLSTAKGASEIASAVIAGEGLEAAVAVVLGEAIGASLTPGESSWWQRVKARPAHPTATVALLSDVSAPEEILAALSGVGIAVDEEAATLAALTLLPGQSVVTKDGRLWRWDGYRSSTAAAAAEAIRRTGRLRELERLCTEAQATSSTLETVRLSAKEAATRALFDENARREALKAAKADIERLRRENEENARRRTALDAQLQSASDLAASLAEEAEAVVERLVECEAALDGLPSAGLAETTVTALQRSAGDATRRYEEERSKLEKTKRDANTRFVVIQNAQQKILDFDRRLAACRSMIAELLKRSTEIAEEAKDIELTVALAPEVEAAALENLEETTIAHETAVAQAADAERRLVEARFENRDVEALLAARREDRARLLAEAKAFNDAAAELSREVAERLGCPPSDLSSVAGVNDEAELPELDACEARVQRLSRERETLGTVNLLAEEQLAEVEGKLGEANKARDELREAVRRLRESISKFDRERRERMTEAFAMLDGNFQDLFARLFRGGNAYLKLSGSDDILQAGLEIYAAPPGKKLQSLSLLSGGEQALSALALIFAAFLIRPAPVCVLDEVDAPLDDANVDRLCSLVEELSKETTRFLVITHHALTMARCDRLYGVTMAERGVSRLTTLDMEQAVAWVESFADDTRKD